MLDIPQVCHKHDFLVDYKHVACNTGGSEFDYSLKHFFTILKKGIGIEGEKIIETS